MKPITPVFSFTRSFRHDYSPETVSFNYSIIISVENCCGFNGDCDSFLDALVNRKFQRTAVVCNRKRLEDCKCLYYDF